MSRKMRLPRSVRRRVKAVLWLVLALIAIAVAGWLFYQFVVVYDFEGFTPGTEPVQDFLPEGGFIRESYPPYDPNATPVPTPMPTPMPTAIPLEKYSLLDTRVRLPDYSYERLAWGISEFRISAPDDNKAFVVRGWGYIAGQDASKSTIYLVVSAKYGDEHRIYLMSQESGSSGVLHPAGDGANLDHADFIGNVRVENTYADGEYRLGLLVVSGKGSSQISTYARLASNYNFVVQSGRIAGLAKDLN